MTISRFLTRNFTDYQVMSQNIQSAEKKLVSQETYMCENGHSKVNEKVRHCQIGKN